MGEVIQGAVLRKTGFSSIDPVSAVADLTDV
jgi:hypothetical protein